MHGTLSSDLYLKLEYVFLCITTSPSLLSSWHPLMHHTLIHSLKESTNGRTSLFEEEDGRPTRWWLCPSSSSFLQQQQPQQKMQDRKLKTHLNGQDEAEVDDCEDVGSVEDLQGAQRQQSKHPSDDSNWCRRRWRCSSSEPPQQHITLCKKKLQRSALLCHAL